MRARNNEVQEDIEEKERFRTGRDGGQRNKEDNERRRAKKD